MKLDVTSVTSLAGGGSLVAPSIVALASWLQGGSLQPSTPIEIAVFYFMLFRVVLIFVVPRFRRMKSPTPMLVLTGDAVVLPSAVLLYFLTGDLEFATFGIGYLAAWLSASLLLYPPVVAVAIADGMLRRSKLIAVVPAAAGEFVLSTLVLEAVSAGGAAGTATAQSLSSVARLALGNLKGQLAVGPETSLLIVGCSALLFVSLAGYSVTAGSSREGRLVPKLSMCVAGTAVLLVWIQLTSSLQPWEAFGLPISGLLGFAWVITREG